MNLSFDEYWNSLHFKTKNGTRYKLAWSVWQAAQPTPEQYAQAARQIADESCVAYEEGRWLTTKEVEQILHSTLGRS